MSQLLDRSQPPIAGPVIHPTLPTYHTRQLANGIPVYLLPFGSVEVATIQVIYPIGKNHQQFVGQFNRTARLMLEGTKSYNSLEIAQTLDGAGAWMTYDANERSMVFKIATLSKNFPKVMDVFREVLFEPTFPEAEFNRHIQQSREQLMLAAEKTKTKAVRAYRHQLFGADHPYGRHMSVKENDAIQLQPLKDCWAQYLGPHAFKIAVVGNFEEGAMMDLLETQLGQIVPQAMSLPADQALRAPLAQSGRVMVPHEGMQATIRTGHIGVARNHPDFYALTVLNTILGGYFGSRLMKNIREEKGYTYGISSGIVALQHHGHWVIQSDVGKEYIEPTLTEIDKEIRTLQEKPVSADELQLVKNYLMGRAISQRETPWQIAEILAFSLTSGLSFAEFDRRFEVINGLSAADIQRLAQEHLQVEDRLTVVTDGSA